jgi:hypothetical protein
MNNEIVLKSVYGKVNQIYFIQPCPNPRTGRLPDCVKPVRGPAGNTEMILSEDDIDQMSKGLKHFIPADHVFEIVDGTVFNLDDVVDRANWEAIQYCNWIAKDRYERDEAGNLVIDGGERRYGVADLYVDRPGEIAKARVTKKQLIHTACSYIYEDSEYNRIKKAKVLGRDLKNAIPADVLDYLIEYAEKDPQEVINLYEGEDWKLQLFILEAIDKGVIRKSEGIYKYDDKLIGGSMKSAIEFLKDIKYKKLVDSMKRETYPELLPKLEQDKLEEDQIEDIKQTVTKKSK